jgi:hypothetical protein
MQGRMPAAPSRSQSPPRYLRLLPFAPPTPRLLLPHEDFKCDHSYVCFPSLPSVCQGNTVIPGHVSLSDALAVFLCLSERDTGGGPAGLTRGS